MHFPVQVVLGGLSRHRSFAHLQLRPVTGRRVGVLHHEQHLEQWRLAEAALWRQVINDLIERHVLMVLRVQHAVAHLAQQAFEIQRRIEVGAHHQSVDEATDQRLQFGQRTLGHRAADPHVALVGVAPQQQLRRAEHQHVQGGTALLGELTQASRQFLRQLQLHCAGGRVEQVWTTLFGGQVQQVIAVFQLGAPVFELVAEHCLLTGLALPEGVIRVLQGQVRQYGDGALALGGVELRQFIQQVLAGRIVGGAMVHGQQQQRLVATAALHQRGTNRHLGSQVETVPGFGVNGLIGQQLPSVVGGRFQCCHAQGDVDLRFDDQRQLAVAIAHDPAAQDFVALNHTIQGGLQGLRVQLTIELYGADHVVFATASAKLFEEPQALLFE